MKNNLSSADFVVYALIDPRDSQIFYIGSCTDVLGRYRSHVTAAIAGQYGPRPTRIRAILKEGAIPQYKTLRNAIGEKAARLAELDEMEKHNATITNKAYPISAKRANKPHVFKPAKRGTIPCDASDSNVFTITANVTEGVLKLAKKRAIDERKSLRVWAGEVIADALNKRKSKAGTKPAN
jgi:hypothetical protein